MIRTRWSVRLASALGAGMSAAVGAGWFKNFQDAARAMSRTAEATDPDLAARKDWRDLSLRQARIYQNNRE